MTHGHLGKLSAFTGQVGPLLWMMPCQLARCVGPVSTPYVYIRRLSSPQLHNEPLKQEAVIPFVCTGNTQDKSLSTVTRNVSLERVSLR